MSRAARSVRLVVAGVLVLSLVLLAACGGGGGGQGGGTQGSSKGGGSGAASSINGAGASFPAPIYNAMFQQFAQDSGIQVNYQSIGSSGGRQQFIQKTVEFGASDEPMKSEEEQEAGGNPLHIATVGGAVVPAFNLEGVQKLNLTGEVLADIFLGNVTKWNDPAIAQLNPDANLPDAEIAVVHRSDGSGTTNIFTNYLAAVSPAWKNGPGAGGEIDWPTGIGGKGNEGVAGQIQQTPNSIGYVGLEYAKENNMSYASVGEAGNFVEPSVESARAAIQAANIPDDLKVTISGTNLQGQGVYPITGLTWLLVRQQMDDLAKCKAVAQAAWYVTHQGQQLAPEMNYVQIPDNVVSTDEKFIQSMEAGGQSCYEG
ncbi:MAG: phosphate transport system substrate-binding protein [Rubrobacteraceae bacterium]|nr:phosphate transport system substrate-binding protein [Rubrobacteraceae bacterium]